MRVVLRALVSTASLTLLAPAVLLAQLLETETARLPAAGALQLDNTLEYQTSSEGTELALPQALQYSATNRLELMVEPVFYTDIQPKEGRHAAGLGDLEVTLTYLVRPEMGDLPALALAGEVKVPTARDSLIGTRATDYTGYLIASKRFNRIDTHVNLAYAVIGKPAGVADVRNTFNVAAAAQYRLSERFEVDSEVLANTSATPGGGEGDGSEGSGNPEIAGEEVVALLGARYQASPFYALGFGVTYDNNNAVLVRSVLTLRFR